MFVPKDFSDIVKLVIVVVCLVGAIVLQATNHDIPLWLTTVVSGAIAYYFGLNSGNSNSNNKDDNGVG